MLENGNLVQVIPGNSSDCVSHATFSNDNSHTSSINKFSGILLPPTKYFLPPYVANPKCNLPGGPSR